MNETKNRIRRIFRIAFPLIIQGLVSQLQSLTDKAFLGNLDTRYVSAVGAAQMPFYTTVDFVMAFSTGLVIIVSRLYGAGKHEEIRKHVKSSAVFSTFIQWMFFILWFFFTEPVLSIFQIDPVIIHYSVNYIRICSLYLLVAGFDSSLQAMLQGIGDTKPVMFAGMIKVGLNIFFSWVLIFGKFGFPAMNVEGAAIGTIAANIFSIGFIFLYCFLIKRKELGLLHIDREWIQIKPYLNVIKLGFPVGLEYLLWGGSNLVLVRFINGFSYMDMTIYTLVFSFQLIVYVIFEGTSKSTMTLIGQSIGAGKPEKANGFFNTTIIINFGIILVSMIFFFIMPERLMDIFSDDPVVIVNSVPYLRMLGFIMLSQSLNIICGNAIRANGNTKWMLTSQFLGSAIVIGVSCFLIKVLHMNMTAVFITLFLDETIRGIINLVYYKKKYGTPQAAAIEL